LEEGSLKSQAKQQRVKIVKLIDSLKLNYMEIPADSDAPQRIHDEVMFPLQMAANRKRDKKFLK